jgi:hypothetical protein
MSIQTVESNIIKVTLWERLLESMQQNGYNRKADELENLNKAYHGVSGASPIFLSESK